MPIGLQKGIVMTMLRNAGSLKNDKKFNMREIVIDAETTAYGQKIRTRCCGSVDHHRGQTAVSGYEVRARRPGKVAPRTPGLGFLSHIG
jgi:hypothetical protein